MIKLRDYQQELVDKIRDAYRQGYRAPLVQLPTGGGKTTIFSYVTANAYSKGNPVFLLAHRAELVKQISMTLAKFGVSHRIVAQGAIIRQCQQSQFEEIGKSYVDSKSLVIVASVQTLVNRFHEIKFTPSIIIVDECHHLIRRSTWGKIIANYPQSKLLLVSATPCRLDGQGLGVDHEGYADTIINGAPMRWLIDNGYLSEYRLFAPPVTIDLSKVKKSMGDYKKSDLENAMDKPTITGDVVIHYQQLSAGKRAVAFCCSIAHACHVRDEFKANGIAADVLDGTLSPEERDACIKKFESSETLVLCTVDVVSEGFDLPAINTAINLRPTLSLSLYLQQMGRVLRPSPGKGYAIIIDHVGATQRHGFVDDEREWSLDGVKKSTGKSEETISIKTCEKCFHQFRPQPVCPNCGSASETKARKIDTVGGQLVELTKEQRELLKLQQQKQRKQEQKQCKTLDELIQLGIQREYVYPRQWAEKIWHLKNKYRTS